MRNVDADTSKLYFQRTQAAIYLWLSSGEALHALILDYLVGSNRSTKSEALLKEVL